MNAGRRRGQALVAYHVMSERLRSERNKKGGSTSQTAWKTGGENYVG